MYEIKTGAVIKRMLWKLRKNLKDVSRETGIPHSTLHTWQENRQPKNIVKAQVLADYFQISLHELLFDTPDAHKEPAQGQAQKEKYEEFFKGRFEVIVRKIE